MTATALLGFSLALMVAAGSPGPSIAALVARVLTGGLREVLPFLAAMWIGEAVWLTVTVAGLAVVAQAFAMLLVVIKFAGVAYLLWLAWRMWTADAEAPGDQMPSGQRPWRMFLAGMAITLGNPKIMVFYLAVVPTLLDLGHLTLPAWAELTLTMFVVLMAIDLGWAVAAARARRLLRNRRAVRIANRTSATVMAGAAAAIAAE
jgi:threonine/homoserine/homoserine lactone efflux protein